MRGCLFGRRIAEMRLLALVGLMARLSNRMHGWGGTLVVGTALFG
jgi:hypothetical protein